MTAEDLLINDGCNGQTVKTICECLPQLYVVSSLALIIESIDTIDAGTLMIAPQ